MRFILIAVAMMMAIALVGCLQPGVGRPDPPDVADELDVSQSEGELTAAAMTRGGSTCRTSNNEVELCSTEAGSVYPDTHGGDKFKVVLKFSEAVTMHLRSVPGIIGVRYGEIRNVKAIDATQVPLTYQRPGTHPAWAHTQSSDQWEFWVHPAPNRPRVTLTIHNRACDRRNAICSTATYKKSGSKYHKPLKASLTIAVIYEDPNPPAPPNTDPPGPVRNVVNWGNHAGWQAPSDHGGAFITEYRILAGGCDGRVEKTLLHPDDFWMHGGHNGRYNTYKGWRGAVGVQAVNRHGAGPCGESS